MKASLASALFWSSCLAVPIEEFKLLIREAEPQFDVSMGSKLGANVGANMNNMLSGLRVAAAVTTATPRTAAATTSSTRPAATTATTTSSARPAATTATTPGSSDGSSTYINPIVSEHNKHRSNHTAPNIAWDTGLANTAQKIASSCYYGHNTTVDGGGYGQNIGAGYLPSQAPAMITNGMYNGEVGYYPGYGKEPDMTNFAYWGHFSQIVWNSTTKVGCFTQYCPNGLNNTGGGNIRPYFTVCNYSPPGNYLNRFAANVLAPKSPPDATTVYPM